MNKVYILYKYWRIDEKPYIIGVYSNKREADEDQHVLQSLNKGGAQFDIEEADFIDNVSKDFVTQAKSE